MPIYEFDCSDCGEDFEALTFGFNTDKVKCPQCEGQNIQKKISTFASQGNSTSSSFSSTAACAPGGT